MRVLIVGSKRLCLRMTERFLGIDHDSIVGVVTFDDSTDTRSELAALVALGDRARVPVHIARDRRHSEALIRDAAPDLGIVLNWYWLLSRECLSGARAGFLGVHMSPLPRYRGTSPIVWQIINGEPSVGYSVFSLNDSMDEGDLWAQGSVPLGPDDHVAEVLDRLEHSVGTTFDMLFPSLLDSTARPYPQPDIPASYCAARHPDDGEIDFSKPARRCHDFIRAQSRPYPGAFTNLDGERLTIWRSRPLDVTYFGRPGQVARVAADGVTVICGDNHPLLLTEVGWRGQDVTASEVIRSVKTRLPERAL